MMIEAPNRNLLWAKVFVDELARSGLHAVCIAPGSRSTPLVMAFAEHPNITVYSHIDERSAAFFALGHALASDRPVAVLCSSGTAGANFHPAVIEAYYARVPLLVLTADRAHELRDSGANQTIDQIKMFGDHVRWAVDVALPEANPPALVVRSLRTLACRAYATADGRTGTPRGPVHLNFPFRKPLEPTQVESDLHTVAAERPKGTPFTRFERPVVTVGDKQIADLAEVLSSAQRPLIVCGPRCPGGDFTDAVAALANKARAVLLADALTEVRWSTEQSVMGSYDTYIRLMPQPDVIVQFGNMPTSQALEDYLLNAEPQRYVWVSADGVWNDANHRIDTFIHADSTLLCRQIVGWVQSEPPGESGWQTAFHEAERAFIAEYRHSLERDSYFDGAVLTDVVSSVPTGSQVFVASSLSVRHLEQFGFAIPRFITVYANRGASGIDGTVSSALGAASAHPERLTVLVTGDLALYHDLNGLLAVKRGGINLVIVVLNNNGGGIFHRLPIAQYDPPFTELFVTPHGLTFEHAAQMYGLAYARVSTRAAFIEAFASASSAAVGGKGASIIEVPTDAKHDAQRRQDITQRVLNAIKNQKP